MFGNGDSLITTPTGTVSGEAYLAFGPQRTVPHVPNWRNPQKLLQLGAAQAAVAMKAPKRILANRHK